MGLAAPTPSSAAKPLKVREYQVEVRQALADGLGIGFTSERFEVTPYGRHDLVVRTDTPLDGILEEVRRRYRTRRTMNGWRVVGYAYQNASDSWTITLRSAGKDADGRKARKARVVVEGWRDGDGTRLAIWGSKVTNPSVIPLRPLPRRVLKTSDGLIRR